MMTPQEVANCTFAKSMVGGYNMSSVDDFLDKLTEDYSALYKENAALKSKLKTVTEKLAEYREMENAMSSTLLTAQKMATAMMAEAEQKKGIILADAAAVAQAKREKADQAVAAQEQRVIEARERVDKELEAERKRLLLGQEKLRAFIRDVTSVCNEQLELLKLLPEMPMDEPEQAAVPMPNIPVMPSPAPAPAAPVIPVIPAAPAAPVKEAVEPPPAVVAAFAPMPQAPDGPVLPEGDPFASDDSEAHQEDLEETRVLDDLQFGRNYKRD